MTPKRISDELPPDDKWVLLGRHGSGWAVGRYNSKQKYKNDSHYQWLFIPDSYVNNIDCWCELPEKPEGLI